MYKFVVCVDPDTAIYYSYNLTNFEIHIQEIADPAIREAMSRKAKVACEQLKQIISWGQYKRIESQEVWKYRRRILPTYLLQESKIKLPAYIVQEPLPPSLSEQLEDEDEKGQTVVRKYRSDIQVQVYLDEYYNELRRKYMHRPNFKVMATFKCQLKLVTAQHSNQHRVNEVLKIIYKSALQQMEIEFAPIDASKKFVLKVLGCQDYLYGQTPLMNYLYIRKCLRNKQEAKLVLTEKFIQEHKQQRKFVVERQIAQVDLGIYKEIDWQTLLNQQPILWYPPFPLTQESIKQISTRQTLRTQYDIEKQKTAILRKQNPFYQSEVMENIRCKLKLLKQPRPQRPRFMLKQQALKQLQIRKSEIDRRIVTVAQGYIYSGECEFNFQMRIIGIDNLLKMFKKHPKYSQSLQLTEKLMTSHSQYNSQVFTTMKKANLVPFVPQKLLVKASLTYSDSVIMQKSTNEVFLSNSVRFQHALIWKQVSVMPLESKIFLQVMVFPSNSKGSEGYLIGSGSIGVFDQRGFLRQGQYQINLWPFKENDLRIAGCVGNYTQKLANPQDYTKLTVRFPKYTSPVQWSLRSAELIQALGCLVSERKTVNPQKQATSDLAKLQKLLKYNPLQIMKYTQMDKQLLVSCKSHYSKLPDKYVNYLYSVDWLSPEQVRRAIKSREQWEPLRPIDCIPLLSTKIVDESIRFYAVERMSAMLDDEVVLYMLQLVQSLTVQPMHHNALSQFILQRSLLNPVRVGHSFFWQLRSQLYKPFQFQRYALYLQTFAMLSQHRREFCQQIRVNVVLTETAAKVVNEEPTIELKNTFFKSKLLPKLKEQLPNPFVLAINPQKKNDDFLEQQCKVFDSKKVPLLLTLVQDLRKQRHKDISSSPRKLKAFEKQKDKETSNFRLLQRVIFKSGDDIRQDQLTLQILKIMDNIWLDAGYDFKMSVYRVLPVDDMIGYIQVVENAQNNSSIHTNYGGTIGALVNDTFELYLRKHNPSRQEYRNAKDNFIRSNVGYLVASYVLGLGDRHSGNAMITKNGMFFHIDFGHFLGNFKQKLNIKRERNPFLFTSQFVHVMGGRQSKAFRQFEELCGIAYNLIRKNAGLIINMFAMMVAAGIPQLYEYGNIKYLIDKLALDLSTEEASILIRKQIKDTLDGQTTRRLDNLVHEMKRAG